MVNLNVNINSDYSQILFLTEINNKSIVNNIPVQPNTSGNFRQLVLELLNKNFSEEKIKIIENIVNNEKLYNALNQAAAFFIITGEIKNMPLISDTELENNNIIKEISLSNNLNPSERNLLINALKLTAIEIAANLPETANTVENLPLIQQSNINKSDIQNQNSISSNIPQNDYLVNNNNINNIFNRINYLSINNITEPRIVQVSVNERIVPQNISVITEPDGNNANNNSVAILSTESKILNSNKIPLTSPVIQEIALNNSQMGNKIINNEQSDAPQDVKINFVNKGSINMIQDFPGETLNILENIKEIIAGIKISANKFVNENNVPDKDNIIFSTSKELNLKIDNIINLINKIKIAVAGNNAETNQTVKQHTELLIKEIINILPVLYNIIYKENTQNNFIAVINSKIESVEIPAVNINSQQLINSGLENENNNPKYQNETRLFNEIKDSVLKIFTLLQELNGEMQIYRKIEYVYQPNTTKTSTITPEGVLLINLSPMAGEKGQLNVIDLQSQITLIKKDFSAENPNVANNINENISKETKPVITQMNFIENKQIQSHESQPLMTNTSLKQDIILKNNNDISFIMNNILNNINKDKDIIKSDKNNILKEIIQSGYKIKEETVIRQLVEKLTSDISIKEKIQIKIYLRPENLGPVFIKIENKGKEVSANIQVANSEVKDILKANITELKNSLNNLGIDVKEFEISMMHQNIGNNFSDTPKNIYKEWEGASVIDKNVQEIADFTDIYDKNFSYLNYLA